MPTPLFDVIADEIHEGGPIGLDRYMGLCLGHPVHGYYRSRDPFGATGDFTTAPEISQMFGELIGVWMAATAAAMGAPAASLRLVELGPGRGTLMADAVRALRALLPGTEFHVHLVESSPLLRARQAERLADLDPLPCWHEDLATLPEGPALVVANEFFDALPARQFERGAGGWHERRVGLSRDGTRLALGLSPEPVGMIARGAPPGTVLTLPSKALDTMRLLSRRIAMHGGALLAIDYGHDRPGFGDTFQAMRDHRFVDPLEAPGEADITVHVDFAALASAAAAEGARVHGPIAQSALLLGLGLRLRADRLKAAANPKQAESIEAAVARLTDPQPRGMGALFKGLAVTHPALTTLPGFPAPA